VLPSRAVACTLAKVAGTVAALLALALGVAACGDGGGSGANLPDGIVAQVGDFQIGEEELDRAVEQQIALSRANGASVPEKGSAEFTALRRQALDGIVIQRLVEVEARKCGTPCRVTASEVDAELKRIRDQQFQGSQRRLQEYLDQAKLTLDDARRIVRLNLQEPKLFAKVTRGIRFTEADARRYYDENRSQFRVPAGRTARHILVKTKAEAEAIRARVTDANFAQIARRESLDPGSAKQGGDLGQIQRGQLVPEFEQVAFALRDGEISQPVQTQFGWHIIQVHVTPARTTPFAEAKNQIIQSQLQQRRNEAFSAWRDRILESWRKRARYADPALDPTATTGATTQAPTTGSRGARDRAAGTQTTAP